MNVNGIGKQPYYEKTGKAKACAQNGGSGFYESLSENLEGRCEAGQKKESAAVAKSAVANTGYSYRGVSAVAGVYESREAGAGAVSECEARRIAYQESDYVKVLAEQGYSLMAQVDVNARSIYIEQKMEDGTIKGYEVDMDKLDRDTADPIGRMALEAWEKEMEEKEDGQQLTVEEALLGFYEFIEDRIKNGPPKYLIGNSEFSAAEWDKLLEGIDGQLDAIKEELRERIEKLKEQQLKADMSQELQSAQDDLRDAENEKIEEELLLSLFQDRKKI